MAQTPTTPTGPITTRGYEAPMNTQFSVFLSNRVGKMLELVNVFDGHALKLAAMSVVDSADHAVIRVVTSRAELARRLLKRHELPFSEADVLLVEIDEARNRTLADMCATLLEAEINILYSYPLLVRPHGLPALAVCTDDQILAGQVLRRKLFTLLGENDLGENATGSSPSGPINHN
jgi:hypothetical protein